MRTRSATPPSAGDRGSAAIARTIPCPARRSTARVPTPGRRRLRCAARDRLGRDRPATGRVALVAAGMPRVRRRDRRRLASGSFHGHSAQRSSRARSARSPSNWRIATLASLSLGGLGRVRGTDGPRSTRLPASTRQRPVPGAAGLGARPRPSAGNGSMARLERALGQRRCGARPPTDAPFRRAPDGAARTSRSSTATAGQPPPTSSPSARCTAICRPAVAASGPRRAMRRRRCSAKRASCPSNGLKESGAARLLPRLLRRELRGASSAADRGGRAGHGRALSGVLPDRLETPDHRPRRGAAADRWSPDPRGALAGRGRGIPPPARTALDQRVPRAGAAPACPDLPRPVDAALAGRGDRHPARRARRRAPHHPLRCAARWRPLPRRAIRPGDGARAPPRRSAAVRRRGRRPPTLAAGLSQSR